MAIASGFDEDGSCLECEDGHAQKRTNRQTLVVFWGCSNFPACRNSAPIGSELQEDDDDGPRYDR